MTDTASADFAAGNPAPGGPSERLPAAWLIGFGFAPLGLVYGFAITALPYLLTTAGISVDRAAEVSATVMSPTFWAFLFTPILDTGLTRRSYCWITISVSAVCMATALFWLSPKHLGVTTALLLIGEFCGVLYGSAVNGWQAEFVSASARGPVGGWTNVANLGCGALGSLAIMDLSKHFAVRWLGPGVMVALFIAAAPLLFYPKPRGSLFKLRQVFSSALRATWQASRRRECLTGFALFLAPACSVAAINLFSALGPDFHTSSATVIGITGGGCAASASLGALIGGYTATRIPTGYVYLYAGVAGGLCALALAFAPHTAAAFVCGALFYNACAGIAYAAFNALILELVGHHSAVASTQLGLFAAATNAAVVYMTWADGVGYRHAGVRGLLCVDGLAALASAIPLLFLVRHELRRYHSLGPQEDSLASLVVE